MSAWDAGMTKELYGRLPSDFSLTSGIRRALPGPTPVAQPSPSSSARPQAQPCGSVLQQLQEVRSNALDNSMQAQLPMQAPPPSQAPSAPAPTVASPQGVQVAPNVLIAILLKLVSQTIKIKTRLKQVSKIPT